MSAVKLSYRLWLVAISVVSVCLIVGVQSVNAESWRDKVKNAVNKVKEIKQEITTQPGVERQEEFNEITAAMDRAGRAEEKGDFRFARVVLETPLKDNRYNQRSIILVDAYNRLAGYCEKEAAVKEREHPSWFPPSTIEIILKCLYWGFVITWAPVILFIVIDVIGSLSGEHSASSAEVVARIMSGHKIGLAVLFVGAISLGSFLLLENWYAPIKDIYALRKDAAKYRAKSNEIANAMR